MIESVNSRQFAGRVAIVTGAGHGFGRAVCKELALRGAQVLATDILERELEETRGIVQALAKEAGSAGVIEAFQADITDSKLAQAVVDQAAAQFGTVHILVNNAGGVAGQVHQPIEAVTDEQWEKVVDINLTAAFYMTRAVAPLMKRQQYGRIVNVSSGAGRSFSLTGIQAYASSKAGQIGFTRQMARELGAYGITVNNVAPGFVLSNPSTIKQWEAMGEEGQRQLVESISLRRLGEPEEIARPVLFFASDEASYVSGQVISVDGGKQMF